MMKKKYFITNKLVSGMLVTVNTLRGYRFKIAETPQELQDAYNLRFKIYQKEVIHNSSADPDAYDAHSVILIAYKGKTAIATMRMVMAEKGNLTTELYCPDLFEDVAPNLAVEIGGLAIEKAHRSGSKFVFLSLLRLGLDWCARNNRSHWIGISTSKKVELFKALNPNLVLKEAISEHVLETRFQARRRENDRIQVNGQKPVPFIIDISAVDYVGAVRFYVRKLRRKKSGKGRRGPNSLQGSGVDFSAE